MSYSHLGVLAFWAETMGCPSSRNLVGHRGLIITRSALPEGHFQEDFELISGRDRLIPPPCIVELRRSDPLPLFQPSQSPCICIPYLGLNKGWDRGWSRYPFSLASIRVCKTQGIWAHALCCVEPSVYRRSGLNSESPPV